ncbi:MAG: CNNM domain-containing protein, partial [Chthoniobacterales bacterium]|nr:CNNM domain-containing protein [Chthoniobacterales bacterium]
MEFVIRNEGVRGVGDWGELAEFLPVGLVALVLLHGFFVAAEIALVKVRKSQLEVAEEDGDRRAKIASELVEELDDCLATTQFGMTITSLGLGWFGSTYLAHFLEPLLLVLTWGERWLTQAIAFLVAFGILVYAHMVLGALVPKSLGIRHALPVALALARPLSLFRKMFRLLVCLPSLTAKWFLRRVMKTELALATETVASEEELRVILEENPEKGGSSSLEREIIRNALDMK